MPTHPSEKVHVDVDDATRLSYVEVLADEKGQSTVGFHSRAAAWFNGQGYRYVEAKGYECRRVLSDNGSAYKSKGRRTAALAMGLKVNKPGLTPQGPTARPSGLSSRRLLRSSRHCWRSEAT
jgi:hypothetical protein